MSDHAEPTPEQVESAAQRWAYSRSSYRHACPGDFASYFRNNWRHFPELRAYVEGAPHERRQPVARK